MQYDDFQIEEMKEEIERLNKALDSHSSKNDKLRYDIERYEKQLNELKNDLDLKDNLIDGLKEDISNLKVDIDERENKIRMLERWINRSDKKEAFDRERMHRMVVDYIRELTDRCIKHNDKLPEILQQYRDMDVYLRYKEGEYQKDIARDYLISQVMVSHIVTKHDQDP